MKTFSSTLLLSLVCVALFGQKISGTVILPDQKPAEYATVTLHLSSDSSLVKGTLTGEDGAFEFRGIAAGAYFLKSNLIGAGQQSSASFQYDGTDKTLAAVVLEDQSKSLTEVTVVARKPVVEVKSDKTVLNVEGTVNSTGLNALELLRKAPGVTVDNNENVSVKGKNSVRIMIDGREVPLDGKDLGALLKGTQAADIANIEIISNPSAKYDAAGNAGIINIKMRKNKALGTNGNAGFEAIYGESFKAGMNVSLNHRSSKVNTFGSYNNHYGDWHNTNDFLREQNNLVFDQKSAQYHTSKWNSFRAGADWFVNEKNTVGVLLNGSLDGGSWHTNGATQISDLNTREQIDSVLTAYNDVFGNRNNFNGNINYRYADTTGRTLNLDLDHGIYRITSRSLQPNYYRSADGAELLNERIYRNNTPTNIDISTAKADYEQKLFKGNFGAGVKVSSVKTDNTFDFFNVVDGVALLDTNVSNQFLYRERTTAGYVNYNRAFGKKLTIQAGLRVENTDYMGDLISYKQQTGNDEVKNNYTEFFPSAAVTYSFNEKLGLNTTYSRRIDRPSYQDLNPFEFKLDELTYQKGNPRLRPQFTNSFEISPTFKGFPVLTFGVSHTKDVFTQILDTANIRATYITQENIADQQNYSLSLNAPTPFAKWWEGMVSLTGFRSHFQAEFRDGFVVDQAFYSLNVYAEQTIKLPKGFSVQVSGWYNSPGYWGTLRSNAQGSMDVGIQKKLFDGKGDLRLRVGDVLGTAGWSGRNLFTPGLNMTARGTWESQTVTLNFSYRFGSSEVKGARQRNTGLDDESRRVKGKG